MDAFISRKRRRSTPPDEGGSSKASRTDERRGPEVDEESTDVKLALLASLHPKQPYETLMEALLACDGSVEAATEYFGGSPRKKAAIWKNGPGYQSSIAPWSAPDAARSSVSPKKPLTKKGKTLYLYSPEDIETHTPCSIIHNFLPNGEAEALLRELLEESPTFKSQTFQLFERTVSSPHTICFYVDSLDEAETQKKDYVYNGSYLTDVRKTLPEMRKVSAKVQAAVNAEVQRRIRERYPDGKKLKYQSPREWKPNAAFVNCYDGGAESVGYHSDQLTYIGPRAIIGSLSLGVAREFRVRKIVARDDDDADWGGQERADAEGQISIHLPHNSLLVMHAEMQEEWKHSIAPAQAIDPHPIAENKRINITYRCYKDGLHPKLTPKCRCGLPTVLRCVQRRKENRGRYMWMCHSNYTPGGVGCGYFQWAEFDDDGEPPWVKEQQPSVEAKERLE